MVTRYGRAAACRHIGIAEADHPVPHEAGLEAAARIQALVSGLGAHDPVPWLISGGGGSARCRPRRKVPPWRTGRRSAASS